MSFNDQIDALLDTLGDADFLEIEDKLSLYDADNRIAVLAKRLLALGGGGGDGGSSSYGENWALIDLNFAPTLDAGTPSYFFAAADMSIHSQSGSDFSIGTVDHGAVLSASGGWFQAACFVGAPGRVTLDGGSTDQRWMEFFLECGDDTAEVFNGTRLGVDTFVPVLASANGDLASTGPGVPGKAEPGGMACGFIGVEFINPFGTDEIAGPIDNFGRFLIWQIA